MNFKTLSSNKKLTILLFLICIVVAVFFSINVSNKLKHIRTEGWSENTQPFNNYEYYDAKIKSDFLIATDSSHFNKYNALFKYFAQGAFEYKSNENAFISYPGAISSRGRRVNALEGFARFFALAASWLNAGNSNIIILDNGSYNLKETLKAGILAGTDKNNIEYWGDISDFDQRIVEAVDVALGLWLSQEQIWNEMSLQEKNQVNSWLNQAINKQTVDNNWNLFPVIIAKCQEALGYVNTENLARINTVYTNYKTKHYLGSGWFDDPPKGIDYYNAWSIHYTLFWIDQIDPNFDHEFIKTSHSKFLSFYRYFFSENGFPIMGRSICYRMAAPAPIISGALLVPEDISPGFALNALDVTWNYFIENNALEYGTVTQGYFKNNLSILDPYTGTGSCLWSLRSLIVAFYVDKQVPLWSVKKVPLPIQESDFNITNNDIGWSIIGDKETQTISLKIDKNVKNSMHQLNNYNFINQLQEFVLEKPSRPDNTKALYYRPEYSTENNLFLNKRNKKNY
ncbi:DUF2264 domain-containing protein [Formosa algae]|uniref:DUF2264 domain-containing protein n=1 Tax=Formosa algae TaxID=225843 RepID=A0A9X0YN59_9FLAO|nr:DUF2264 domain-containing protein [Formosa algae]MBP1841704.1 hypothetical protein [Formosa algae]MDQ0337182.1 hypothetical protein [Formosa algae]OEI79872.1 hypothetical protein AST99_12190 [Formosa algae]